MCCITASAVSESLTLCSNYWQRSWSWSSRCSFCSIASSFSWASCFESMISCVVLLRFVPIFNMLQDVPLETVIKRNKIR